jgi:hypothetical protein
MAGRQPLWSRRVLDTSLWLGDCTKGMDAVQACCSEVSRVAGAWWVCDFNQQQENYPDGRTDRPLSKFKNLISTMRQLPRKPSGNMLAVRPCLLGGENSTVITTQQATYNF